MPSFNGSPDSQNSAVRTIDYPDQISCVFSMLRLFSVCVKLISLKNAAVEKPVADPTPETSNPPGDGDAPVGDGIKPYTEDFEGHVLRREEIFLTANRVCRFRSEFGDPEDHGFSETKVETGGVAVLHDMIEEGKITYHTVDRNDRDAGDTKEEPFRPSDDFSDALEGIAESLKDPPVSELACFGIALTGGGIRTSSSTL